MINIVCSNELQDLIVLAACDHSLIVTPHEVFGCFIRHVEGRLLRFL